MSFNQNREDKNRCDNHSYYKGLLFCFDEFIFVGIHLHLSIEVKEVGILEKFVNNFYNQLCIVIKMKEIFKKIQKKAFTILLKYAIL